MTVECPACGSEEFALRRESGYDGAGFAIFCSGCGNATAQVVARTLDGRLQREESQLGFDDLAGGENR